MTGKPLKKAVALAIYDEEDRILSVLRPEDDEDHPGMWGMPATSLNEEESWKDAVKRAGREKLGVEVEIEGMESEGVQERERYDIRLRNYRVDIKGEPEVPQEGPGTQYKDWTWKPVEEMQKTAEEGDSLCTSLLLDRHGFSFDMPDNIVRDSINHR